MTSFPESVEHHFAALSRFGFALSERRPDLVTFRRHDATIRVTFDPRGELDIEIATTGPPAHTVRVTEIDGVEGRRSMFVRREDLDGFVARLAALLFGKYEPFLLGDLRQIEELAKADAVASRELTWHASHGPVLRAADEAWKVHDHASVAHLLGPLESGLQPRELRRLRYARSHTR